MCFCVFPSRCVISSSFCVTHPAPHSSGSQTFRSLRTCTSSSILLLGRQSASIFSCISMGRGPISIRSAVRFCQRNAMFCFFIEYFTNSVVPSLRRESAVRLSMIFFFKKTQNHRFERDRKNIHQTNERVQINWFQIKIVYIDLFIDCAFRCKENRRSLYVR